MRSEEGERSKLKALSEVEGGVSRKDAKAQRVKTEVGIRDQRPKSEVGVRRRNGFGVLSIARASIDFPALLYQIGVIRWARYPQSNAKSNQVSVSLFFPSQSVSLLTKVPHIFS